MADSDKSEQELLREIKRQRTISRASPGLS